MKKNWEQKLEVENVLTITAVILIAVVTAVFMVLSMHFGFDTFMAMMLILISIFAIGAFTRTMYDFIIWLYDLDDDEEFVVEYDYEDEA